MNQKLDLSSFVNLYKFTKIIFKHYRHQYDFIIQKWFLYKKHFYFEIPDT